MSWPRTDRARLLDALRTEVRSKRAQVSARFAQEEAKKVEIRKDTTGVAQRAECDRLRAEQQQARDKRVAHLTEQALRVLERIRSGFRAEVAEAHRQATRHIAVSSFVGQDPSAIEQRRDGEVVDAIRQWTLRAQDELTRWNHRLSELDRVFPWTDPARIEALEAPWFHEVHHLAADSPAPRTEQLKLSARAVLLSPLPLADHLPLPSESEEAEVLRGIAHMGNAQAGRSDPTPTARDEGGWGPIRRAWRAY